MQCIVVVFFWLTSRTCDTTTPYIYCRSYYYSLVLVWEFKISWITKQAQTKSVRHALHRLEWGQMIQQWFYEAIHEELFVAIT